MKRTWLLALIVSAALTGSALTWHGVRQEREFRRLVAQGDAALASGQASPAIEAFSGALALKPESMLAHLKRGDAYRRRGELTAALRDLRRAAALDPAATRAWELLGDVNLSMERYARAGEHYARFLAIDERSPRVLYKLALAHYRNGQAAAAIEPLRQAVGFDDRFSEAHFLLGIALRERGRSREAVRSLARAVELAPALSAARAELADLQVALGRTREGIDQLEALAAMNPDRPEGLVGVGLAYARLGRRETALMTLGRAAERHPGAAVVAVALGRVWLDAAAARVDRGALEKALEALQPVAKGPGASTEAMALFGRALFLGGESGRAARLLRQATARLPVEPISFLYLAAASERLGQPDAARQARTGYASLEGAADATTAVAELLRLQRELAATVSESSPDRARPVDRLPGD